MRKHHVHLLSEETGTLRLICMNVRIGQVKVSVRTDIFTVYVCVCVYVCEEKLPDLFPATYALCVRSSASCNLVMPL